MSRYPILPPSNPKTMAEVVRRQAARFGIIIPVEIKEGEA